MEEAIEMVQAKDTKDRMAGVERLQQLLEHSSKALNAMEVSNLVDACMGLMRDNNFRVSQGALQALASAAALSGDHLKLHFNALLPAIVERSGDAKRPVRDAARRLLLALMQSHLGGSLFIIVGGFIFKLLEVHFFVHSSIYLKGKTNQRYAELKNNRLTNYTFNFNQMLDVKGKTAVYILYAHACICSIIWKSGKDIDELKKTGSIQLKHDNERHLGLHVIQFSQIVEDACTDLLPNTLCEYLYNLSEHFTKFYSTCKVLGSEETSRLLLCEATAIVMRECFKLLGITPLYKL